MLKKMLEQARSAKGGINYEMISGFNEMNKNMVDMGLVNTNEQQSLIEGLEEDSNYKDYNNEIANESVVLSPFANGVN